MPYTQQDYANDQLGRLDYSLNGPANWNRSFLMPLQNAYNTRYAGTPQLKDFQTTPLDLQSLTQYLNTFLGGAQQRQAGLAGAAGLAQGSQMNLSNPYMYANRMRDQAYNRFADVWGNAATQLPMLAFQSQLGANNANFGHLATLMGLRNQAASMLPQGGDFMSDLGGFLGQLGGAGLKYGLGTLVGGPAGGFLTSATGDGWDSVMGK